MNLVLFGDSYTAGRIPHTGDDGALRDALGIAAYMDFSKSGSTAQQWAGDLECRLSNVVCSSANIAVGSLGGNDLFGILADGNVNKLECIIASAALFYVLMRISDMKHIILMLYPDPYQGKRQEAAPILQEFNKNILEVITLVNQIQGNKVHVLDLSNVLKNEHFDGVDIHPNLGGYMEMSKAIIKKVNELEGVL